MYQGVSLGDLVDSILPKTPNNLVKFLVVKNVGWKSDSAFCQNISDI